MAAVVEIVNAAVFQESADDADHADVFADSVNAGAKAANAPYEKIDLHPRLGCLIEQADHMQIFEAVHLQDEMRFPAASGVPDFAPDQLFQLLMHVDGSYQQFAKFVLCRVAGDIVE